MLSFYWSLILYIFGHLKLFLKLSKEKNKGNIYLQVKCSILLTTLSLNYVLLILLGMYEIVNAM